MPRKNLICFIYIAVEVVTLNCVAVEDKNDANVDLNVLTHYNEQFNLDTIIVEEKISEPTSAQLPVL